MSTFDVDKILSNLIIRATVALIRNPGVGADIQGSTRGSLDENGRYKVNSHPFQPMKSGISLHFLLSNSRTIVFFVILTLMVIVNVYHSQLPLISKVRVNLSTSAKVGFQIILIESIVRCYNIAARALVPLI